MKLHRKQPADERREDKDSEYIFEHRTEQNFFSSRLRRFLCPLAR